METGLAPGPGDSKKPGGKKEWFVLFLIILFILFVRISLLEVPLERDEGEYAYMGQLLLKGIPPYSQAYTMKFPGTYLMYALLMLLSGQTIAGIHLGFTIVNCITIILIYLLAKKITGGYAALIAAGVYAVLSLSPGVLGLAAHATHFVVLFAVGGTLLLFEALEKGDRLHWYLWSGIVSGIAFIMKQHGLFFILFCASYMIVEHYSSSPHFVRKKLMPRLAVYTFGTSLPLFATIAWLYTSGVFDKFWFWAVRYAEKYVSQMPLSRAFNLFISGLSGATGPFFLVWTLAFLGLIATFFHQRLKVGKSFVLLFTLFSFLSVCPGFYFRGHYFVMLLPAVSILVGILVDFMGSWDSASIKFPFYKILGLGLFITAMTIGIVGEKEYFFKYDPITVSRKIYGTDPFPESLRVAEFIKSRSNKDDKIAVFGSEPQIYFYSDRLSATGYIYIYDLMKNHPYALTMQEEMVHEVESSKPKFITMVHIPTSWLRRPDSEVYIVGWIDNYLRENYSLAGVADIISRNVTIYKWDQEARGYKMKSAFYLLVFEKK